MRMVMRGLTVLMLWQAAGLADGAEWLRLRVAVHVDSSVSHNTRTTRVAGLTVRVEPGARPPAVADIAAMAREQGLDAMVMADFARADIAYGLTPFSRLFKLTVSQGSIATYGARRYLETLRVAEAQSGVIIIPGVESMPYYRWTGGRFTGQPLRLKHAYEHLVLCGFETPEQFERIPNTAGGYGRRVTWAVGLNAVFLALRPGAHPAGPLLAGGVADAGRRAGLGGRSAVPGEPGLALRPAGPPPGRAVHRLRTGTEAVRVLGASRRDARLAAASCGPRHTDAR